MFELVPWRTDIVKKSLSNLQLGQMHTVFEGDERILRIIQFFEYYVCKLVLLKYLYLYQHLLLTPTIGSQHNNNLLQSLWLNWCWKIPTISQLHLVINNSKGKLPSIIFTGPNPVTNLSHSHHKFLLSVDLSQTNLSSAPVLYNKLRSYLHYFSKDLQLLLHAVHRWVQNQLVHFIVIGH